MGPFPLSRFHILSTAVVAFKKVSAIVDQHRSSLSVSQINAEPNRVLPFFAAWHWDTPWTVCCKSPKASGPLRIIGNLFLVSMQSLGFLQNR
ncbi:uncharacterized protein BP01DRAFT_356297 [Aspergillus saccharolyticus JOP 1030-1]|uniref:Uncharacterized protein n=1 Tax=Aspergillus saccharolyticus JOP 1030-1 TaxID=1450539 RepID=A0A318ZH36_9EURO|nr:hypothetical protein BP01DRAFT_356297 [Aspergillus saccharolyticus JOP 1030-1]PYH45674.1 hypothetical protein BP01DRAFT_356297 [Aspergillus saccharolyticus JOP 1030-1]